jgi:hypothetical protein
MIDTVLRTGQLEGMASEGLLAGQHPPDVGGPPAVPGRVGELRAAVAEDRVDPIDHGSDRAAQEVGGNAPGHAFMQFGEGELAGALDDDQHVELAFLGRHFSNIDVEEPDRVALEGFLRLVPRRLRQAADAVALEAALQR